MGVCSLYILLLLFVSCKGGEFSSFCTFQVTSLVSLFNVLIYSSKKIVANYIPQSWDADSSSACFNRLYIVICSIFLWII